MLKQSFFSNSNWEASCKMLSNYPKSKAEDGTPDVVHRSMGKRRTSHQSSEHDLEEQINEWANMTWFLVALGGVCLQQKPRANRPHYGPPVISAMPSLSGLHGHPGLLMSCSTSSSLCTGSTSPATASAAGAAALGAVGGGPAVSGSAGQSSNVSSASSSSGRGTYHSVFGGPVVQEVQYCPVTQ